MNEVNLQDLKLSELRKLYPHLKATSQVQMLELIELDKLANAEASNDNPLAGGIESNVVSEATASLTGLVKNDDDVLNIRSLVALLNVVAKTNNKVLVKCQNSIEADLIYTVLSKELVPQLNENGISVVSSSTRRDFHLNGSCYVRLVCKNNYTHMAGLIKYNVFKEIA